MSRSVLARRGARLIVVCAPLIFALPACSPNDEPVAALEPPDCESDCEHCDELAGVLVGSLPLPPPHERSVPVERSSADHHAHRVIVQLRSHEGVPAAGAHVDLWRHPAGRGAVHAGSATTDVDGIAILPFDGHGVFCVHAEHPAVGSTARAPRQLRLGRTAQDWNVELVLPRGDVVLQRAGIVQIGIAAPDGSPLELSRVAVWRHDFGADEPTLSGTGLTDGRGVVRIELERPGLYAVAASHADHANDSLDYAWYVPRSPRGETREESGSKGGLYVACDAHLRLGPDAPDGLTAPFHEHDLGPDDDLLVTEPPACCRTWVTVQDEGTTRASLEEPAPMIADSGSQLSRRHADPPAVHRSPAETPPPFSANRSTRRRPFDDNPLDDARHAVVRHR